METEETEETEYHGKRSVIGAYTPGYAVASQCDGEAQLRFLRKTPLYSVLLLSPALAANDRVPNNHAPLMSDLSDLTRFVSAAVRAGHAPRASSGFPHHNFHFGIGYHKTQSAIG